MGQPKSAASRKPIDFHHLTARLKLPLAPAFLTAPKSKTSLQLKEEDADHLGSATGDSDEDEKKAVVESDKLAKEYGNNGVLEALNQSIASLLMNYIPSLGSVLVSYIQPPMFIATDEQGGEVRRPLTKTSRVPILTIPGNAWGVVDVEVKLMGWRPTIGQKLVGRPTFSSPSHLSLVIYRTFNASINENHLKAAGFHYDINFEVPANWKSIGDPSNSQSVPIDLSHEHKDRGCWLDANGVVVGGAEATVSFTVMSLTIANNMISVIGSLLDDPFSIEAPIRPSQPRVGMTRGPSGPAAAAASSASSSSDSSDSSDDERPKGLSSRNQLKVPPSIHSSATPRPLLSHAHPAQPPPPLTATNLKALDSLQPAIPPTLDPPSTSVAPPQKPKKTKRKSSKRTADALEEKLILAPNPSSTLPNNNSHPPAASIPPISTTTITPSRKKKLKTT
ncbi:hypothetical protein PTTG_08561 [Puccinia triticina 1-1 BBBD Race 1]|uniref:RPA43_OB domain-containing protein n=1 Tax=Puccinia triticina (isolate 1-1 / race 1 (BBBD)) TaxID=630390 RepID=A0A180G8X2_PUCT1|nr:hypothetical protein PTTG_08561 [Puccinia triticina 1-1 BBBD Race 1]